MVRIFTYITLVVTILLSLSFIILRDKRFLGFDMSRYSEFVQTPFLHFGLLWSLFVYRSFCQLPKSVFYAYVVANASMIISFFATRLYIVMLSDTELTWTIYIQFLIVFIASTILGLVRFSFNLGFQIDQNPHIVLVVLERFVKTSVNAFTHLGKRMSGQMPTTPGASGVDKHFALGVGTFVSTSICAGGAVYVGYEAYQSRLVSIRSAVAAEASAKAAETSAKAAETVAAAEQQKTEIKAVKHGLMSKEEYFKKYPPKSP